MDSTPRGSAFPIGKKLIVLSETGFYRETQVKMVSADSIKIHYIGYESTYDEWVDEHSSRIRDPENVTECPQNQWVIGDELRVRSKGSGVIDDICSDLIRVRYNSSKLGTEWLRYDHLVSQRGQDAAIILFASDLNVVI